MPDAAGVPNDFHRSSLDNFANAISMGKVGLVIINIPTVDRLHCAWLGSPRPGGDGVWRTV